MSKEGRERKRQWKKEMQEDWEILQARLGLEEPPAPRKRFFRHPVAIAVTSVCAVAIIGVSVGLGIYNSSFTQAKTPSTPSTPSVPVVPVVPVTPPPSEQAPPEDQNRYCTQAEYTADETTITLKEYSLENDGKILYFDWYNKIEDLHDFSYSLISTGEIVAFKESFYNIENGYLITLYITDNHTELEELDNFKNTCLETTNVKNVEIKYAYGKSGGYSMWEYNGYRYYMESYDVPTLEYTLGLIEELLQQ